MFLIYFDSDWCDLWVGFRTNLGKCGICDVLAIRNCSSSVKLAHKPWSQGSPDGLPKQCQHLTFAKRRSPCVLKLPPILVSPFHRECCGQCGPQMQLIDASQPCISIFFAPNHTLPISA